MSSCLYVGHGRVVMSNYVKLRGFFLDEARKQNVQNGTKIPRKDDVNENP